MHRTFRDKFNMDLDPVAEQQFRKWMRRQSRVRHCDLEKELEHYDLRGYWFYGGGQNDLGITPLPDHFKKPNHPTFSRESRFHGMALADGSILEGGTWGEGHKTFMPGKFTRDLWDKEQLEANFALAAPSAELVLHQLTEHAREEQ